MKTILTVADKRDLLSKWDTNVLRDLIDSVEAKIIERIGEAAGYFYTDCNGSLRQAHDLQFKEAHTPLYAIPFIEVEE